MFDYIDKQFIAHMLKDKIYLQSKITLSSASTDMNVYPEQLRKYIELNYGNISFHHLVNRYRIKEATELWEEDMTITISEMACITGYSSCISFIYWYIRKGRLTGKQTNRYEVNKLLLLSIYISAITMMSILSTSILILYVVMEMRTGL